MWSILSVLFKGLLLPVGPTFDNVNHTAENELRRLPIDQHFYLLKAL
jgi:hypothetical protein